MKKLLIASTLAFMSSAAFAADAIVYQPVEEVVVVEDVFSWTGGYIGAHGGYGWGKNHDVNNPDAPNLKIKGGFGGVQAGYNWQFDNNVVLGAEADISFGSISKSWQDKNYNNAIYSRYYGKDKVGTHGTIRARLGYAADRFMPYITAGLAIAETKHSLGCAVNVNLVPNGCSQGTNEFETSKSKTKVGYAIGAGLEYAVTNNWTIKTEYLYTDLGKTKVTLNDPNYPDAAQRKFKMHTNEIRFGVNYKF